MLDRPAFPEEMYQAGQRTFYDTAQTTHVRPINPRHEREYGMTVEDQQGGPAGGGPAGGGPAGGGPAGGGPAGGGPAGGRQEEDHPGFVTDDIIGKLKPPFGDDDVVTFRGWLGPLQEGMGTGPLKDGFYNFFTGHGLTRWLQIPKDALLYQLPGKKERDRDAFSIIWVKHEARLIACYQAKACQLVDADFHIDDPTAGGPKYGGGG
jgi:hypothetical protein